MEILNNKMKKKNEMDAFPSCIGAVIENQAREVGIAVFQFETGKLLLSQFVESSRCYASTLMLLHVYQPQELLVVGKKDSGVNLAASAAFTLTPLVRAAFDDTQGQSLLSKYNSSVQIHTNTYLAYGAAGALLRWLENEHKMHPQPGSLEVSQIQNDASMSIDPATCSALELTTPASDIPKCGGRPCSTLLGFLDTTVTIAGSRLLRTNLLQPLRDVGTLNARLDAVDELMNTKGLLEDITNSLQAMPRDFDRMLGNLVLQTSPSSLGMLRRIGNFIQSFIQLRDLLQVLPLLAESMCRAGELSPKSALLCTIRNSCGQPLFATLLTDLVATLEDDAYAASSALMNKTQQCFAVKADVHGLLEGARATLSSLTEQVHELAREYSTRYQLPCKLLYNTKRGFYLLLSKGSKGHESSSYGRRGARTWKRKREALENLGSDSDTVEEDRFQESSRRWIPLGFKVLQSGRRTQKGSVQCSTTELDALNVRIEQAFNDCAVLSQRILEDLSATIVEKGYLAALRRLVDNVAMLDMLCALARASMGSSTVSLEEGKAGGAAPKEWVRPIFTADAGPLVFLHARHPVVEQRRNGVYHPNDTYIALHSTMNIITGPNMSGKTTYLKQVAVLVILACIGCRVPATFASLQPVDMILTRMGTGDSLETKSSSFMVEMLEMSDILHKATHRSLVLIDELGRSTSTADGQALAWALAEDLIERGVPTLFATHFPRLRDLSRLYPCVKDWMFHVDTSNGKLDFSWELRAGSAPGQEGGELEEHGETRYGLRLAAATGFPSDVLEMAQTVADRVEAEEKEMYGGFKSNKDHAREVQVYRLMHKLSCIAQSCRFNCRGSGMGKQLSKLRREAMEILGEQ